ncbi:hypothetical protein [Paenibacillus sp. NPDC058071]|uniref:hypothetical protein n=1 Tax=Paenibacillus sp. NPDC058071 TaxID=3346326 RepID=UPI0036DB9E9D
MKLSGILLGGAVGAAAALIFARKRPGTAALAAAAMSNACSAIGRRAIGMMADKWQAKAVSSISPKRTDDTAEKSGKDWGLIESIVNSDPELKAEADRVMAESSSRTH